MGAKNYKELSTDIRFRDSYQAWIDSGGTLAFQTERAEKSFAKEVYVALRGRSHRH